MLRITDITFRDFRCYDHLELRDLGSLTVFVGPNAIGKSNIVEGIQLLTGLSSFRNATIDQMIKRGCSSAALTSAMTDGNRELELSLRMEHPSKKYQLNGKAKRPADLKGLVPAVTFTPDDLELVKGSMSVRRQAFDALGSQLTANYHLVRKDYEKVIKHKNKLLKEEASPALIDAINELLITCGAQLTCYRVALFERLVPHFVTRYADISGNRETLTATYVPSWSLSECVDDSPDATPFGLKKEEAREHLAHALAMQADEERIRRRCLVGPHADAISFAINGMNATQFGSQGQQRSVVLSYKLAEAAVIEEMLGKKPVLLLDDVMSELDGARREALVDYIVRDVQTFITTANIAYFDEEMLRRSDIVNLPLEPR